VSKVKFVLFALQGGADASWLIGSVFHHQAGFYVLLFITYFFDGYSMDNSLRIAHDGFVCLDFALVDHAAAQGAGSSN
jgi:hypothetical protein